MIDIPQPPKERYWTTKRLGLALLVAVAIVGAVGTAVASPILDGPRESLMGSTGCDEAAKWHYRHALEGGGEEAFYAGLAAQQLEAMGEDCPEPPEA